MKKKNFQPSLVKNLKNQNIIPELKLEHFEHPIFVSLTDHYKRKIKKIIFILLTVI